MIHKSDFLPLIEEALVPNPIDQFRRWFEEAPAANVQQLDAMALAAATKDGKPSVRMVLLKSFGANGFVLYTNYDTRKGNELASNPAGALVFHWPGLERQVRIEGAVEKASPEECNAYLQMRSRESQIGAHVSTESEVLGSREELGRRFEELQKRYVRSAHSATSTLGRLSIEANSLFIEGIPHWSSNCRIQQALYTDKHRLLACSLVTML